MRTPTDKTFTIVLDLLADAIRYQKDKYINISNGKEKENILFVDDKVIFLKTTKGNLII